MKAILRAALPALALFLILSIGAVGFVFTLAWSSHIGGLVGLLIFLIGGLIFPPCVIMFAWYLAYPTPSGRRK